MEPINELLNVRKEKEEHLRQAGIDPYPQIRGDYARSGSLHKEFEGLSAEQIEEKNAHVSYAGRMIAFRDFGKSCFIHIQDREGRVQAYVRKDMLKSPDYELVQEIRRGRHRGGRGKGFQDEDRRADHCRGNHEPAYEIAAPPAREVARPARR